MLVDLDGFKTRIWELKPFGSMRGPTKWGWELTIKQKRGLKVIQCGTTTKGKDIAKDLAAAALALYLENNANAAAKVA